MNNHSAYLSTFDRFDSSMFWMFCFCPSENLYPCVWLLLPNVPLSGDCFFFNSLWNVNRTVHMCI